MANVDNHLVVASHAVPKNVCLEGYLVVVDYDSNVVDNQPLPGVQILERGGKCGAS